MFDVLKRLYNAGRLPAENLKRAVGLGWITADQYTQITGADYKAQ